MAGESAGWLESKDGICVNEIPLLFVGILHQAIIPGSSAKPLASRNKAGHVDPTITAGRTNRLSGVAAFLRAQVQ